MLDLCSHLSIKDRPDITTQIDDIGTVCKQTLNQLSLSYVANIYNYNGVGIHYELFVE